MLRPYETVLILTPVLSDEQTQETVNHYKKILGELGGKVVYEESWGLRKLAYPIKKKNTGYYHLFQSELPGSAIEPFEIALRRDERVLRYLNIKLDKFALEYAERRKAKLSKKKETQKENEKKETIAA